MCECVCLYVCGCNVGGWSCKMFLCMYVNISVVAVKCVGQNVKLGASYM